MNKVYLVSLLFLVAIVINGVYADPFAINYYVNTDSSQEFLSFQYGNYYDNVSFRLRLQATDGYTNVPVVVSPQVYGVDSYGNLNYLYSVPSQTYYVYSTPHEYVYPNVFYLTPDYYGYMVKVYAQATGYYYSTYSYAYVYPINNAPYYYFIEDTETDEDSDFINYIEPDCSDFFLSGLTDISIDEDDGYTYSLYIENEAGQDLEIIDVDTTSPSRLDIEDIDYPDEVPDLSVRTIRLDLESDSVSSDYDSSFEVTVKARYPNSSICTKTYKVDYTIEETDDDDDDKDVSCSDLDIINTSFTIDDDSTSTKKIKLKNNSNDYDFEIDDISISDRDGLDVSIVDEPDEISSDDYEYLEIELEADDFDYDTTKYLTLEVEGAFVDGSHEIKECTRKKTITINIEDDGDNDDETSCGDIDLYVMDISQKENTTDYFSESDGFYVLNNSNRTFTITSLSLNDNSSYASISNLNYTKSISSGNTSSINFTLKTTNVNTTETSRGALSVVGRFSDGRTCSSSNIGVKYFDIEVFEGSSSSDNVCSGIKVSSQGVSSGNNSIRIYNYNNKKFYVNDVLFQNKNGLSAYASDKHLTIPANSSSLMNVGINGNGSLEMAVSGSFDDGKKCSLTQTTAGVLSTGGSSNFSGGSCDFEIIAPTAVSINNSQESINVIFKNNTSKNGRVEITGNGLVTNPSVIFLSGFDSFTQSINLSNFDNPTSITYNAYLNGCSSKSTFTNVINKISDADRISLISYPTFVSPTSNNTKITVNANNSFSVTKNITIKLSGLPSNFITSPKSLTLSAHQTKAVDLDLTIPESASKIAYYGYLELYLDSLLVNKYPITINLSPATSDISIVSSSKQSASKDRTYTVTLTLKNNTSNIQEAVLDFGLPDTYVIDGEKDIYLLPNQEITKIYKIVSPTRLKEEKVIDIKILDKATNKELANEKLILDSGSSPLSAFFSLKNAGLVLLGLIILVILIIIFRKK